MSERQFVKSGNWALASDGLQWMLQKLGYANGLWRQVSFVRSSKAVLARCMREKGCPPEDAVRLLAGLPDTFDQWAAGEPETIAVAGLKAGELSKSRKSKWGRYRQVAGPVLAGRQLHCATLSDRDPDTGYSACEEIESRNRRVLVHQLPTGK